MKTENVILAVVGSVLRVVILLVAVYFIYVGAMKSYDYGYRVFAEPAMAAEGKGKDVTVAVTATMKPKDIGTLLKAKGLIRDENLFVLQYYASEFREDFKPGTYTLNTSMTVEEMMEAMSSKASNEEGTENDN